jgi:hypothetical protein
MGFAGWQAWHASDTRGFVLAAFGRCFVERRIAFNLPLLWRLRRLWREGATSLDPRRLRLAVWLDSRVVLRGVRIDVHLMPPDATSTSVSLGLRALRERASTDDPDGARVFGLVPSSVDGFRRLAGELSQVPKGSALRLHVQARQSSAPPSLRAEFPLRVGLRLRADEGYLTLIRARTVDAQLGAG